MPSNIAAQVLFLRPDVAQLADRPLPPEEGRSDFLAVLLAALVVPSRGGTAPTAAESAVAEVAERADEPKAARPDEATAAGDAGPLPPSVSPVSGTSDPTGASAPLSAPFQPFHPLLAGKTKSVPRTAEGAKTPEVPVSVSPQPTHDRGPQASVGGAEGVPSGVSAESSEQTTLRVRSATAPPTTPPSVDERGLPVAPLKATDGPTEPRKAAGAARVPSARTALPFPDSPTAPDIKAQSTSVAEVQPEPSAARPIPAISRPVVWSRIPSQLDASHGEGGKLGSASRTPTMPEPVLRSAGDVSSAAPGRVIPAQRPPSDTQVAAAASPAAHHVGPAVAGDAANGTSVANTTRHGHEGFGYREASERGLSVTSDVKQAAQSLYRSSLGSAGAPVGRARQETALDASMKQEHGHRPERTVLTDAAQRSEVPGAPAKAEASTEGPLRAPSDISQPVPQPAARQAAGSIEQASGVGGQEPAVQRSNVAKRAAPGVDGSRLDSAEAAAAVRSINPMAEPAEAGWRSAQPAASHPAIPLQVLVRVAEAIRTGARRVQLRLEPPELGHVELEVQERRGQISARLVFSRPEVAHAVDAAVPQFVAMLRDSGLSVVRFDVSVGGGGAEHSGDSAPRRDDRNRRFTGERVLQSPGSGAVMPRLPSRSAGHRLDVRV